ncbi:MAG: PD40 domain-containing protein [Candidatus Eisenbacteria sp.]|nr:PD40 domain-containing protein [Candidatus Eisenbacteria bacterium]
MPPFRLGDFIVRPDLHRLIRGEEVRQIEPRLMQILLLLAERPGEVVSRETLLARVWDEVIVSEETLTVAISDLRAALGDDARRPRFIETIRKGGYRLIAPVEPLAIESPAMPARSTRGGQRRRTAVISAATVALVFIAAILWGTRSQAPPRPTLLPAVPLTSYPGTEIHPARSPDGTRIAFAWNGADEANRDIYVRGRHTEQPLRITDDPAAEYYPAWSPEGDRIAFARSGEQAGVYEASALGGPARQLVGVAASVFGLDWSPDGEHIVYAVADAAGGMSRLVLLTVETLDTRDLTSPEQEFACDFQPRFSPDGEAIAFIRSQGPAFAQNVYLYTLETGETRQITSSLRFARGVAWLAGGRELLVSAAPSGTMALWRIHIESGALDWIPVRGHWPESPALSRDGRVLVYEEQSFDLDIWRGVLQADGSALIDETPLIASTQTDHSPRYSDDGRQVAFVSTRSGSHEIWICDADGGNLQQLTNLSGIYVMAPCWSPNGNRIACVTFPDGRAVIHAIDVASAKTTRLSQGSYNDVLYDWSRDGAWLYFDSDSEEDWQMMRMHPDGSGREPIGAPGCTMICEGEADGSVLFMKVGNLGIWERSLAGEEETLRVPGKVLVAWRGWSVATGGIVFTRPTGQGYVIGFYEFESGEQRALARVTGHATLDPVLAPDGTTLLCCRAEQFASDLMIVDRFDAE